jgi:hypothetical protein
MSIYNAPTIVVVSVLLVDKNKAPRDMSGHSLIESSLSSLLSTPNFKHTAK